MPDRASLPPSAEAAHTRTLSREGRRLIAWTSRLRGEIQAAAEAGRRASRESSELLARLSRDRRYLPGERE